MRNAAIFRSFVAVKTVVINSSVNVIIFSFLTAHWVVISQIALTKRSFHGKMNSAWTQPWKIDGKFVENWWKTGSNNAHSYKIVLKRRKSGRNRGKLVES
jgi:hypothetical protein